MTYQNTTNNLQPTSIEDGTTSITFDTQLLEASGLTLVNNYSSAEFSEEEFTLSFDITEDSDLVFDEQEFDIDLEQLELIPTSPIQSDIFLSFEGEVENNLGQTAFFNPNLDAPDSGHIEISLNSPGNIAPYYATGRQSSPLVEDATRSATLDSNQNLTNFSDYLTDNNINTAEIGFSFGQRSDRDFTETWNAGEDLLGQDWLASPDSTIEERIYQADPDAVQTSLVLWDTPIINFDYSPLYAVFDYGETTVTEDDTEVFFTEAISAQKVDGLDPLADGLADAFLEDLSDREIQLVGEDRALEDLVPNIDPDTGFVVLDIPLPISIRIIDDADLNEESDSVFDGQNFFTATGEIEHEGDIVFETTAGDITVSDLTIGFDASRQTQDISGFFVQSSVDGIAPDDTILFDLGNPNNIETGENELNLDYADVLITPEFSEVLLSTGLATDDLAGSDVGDLSIDAIADSFAEIPMDYV
ncbi:MAG: hypothetical protein QNJ53_26305 [Pleurocapsa sp. MO_192.B19]|nr:hypothetical protein [Pleurocapsa sp. MO_192.B19]